MDYSDFRYDVRRMRQVGTDGMVALIEEVWNAVLLTEKMIPVVDGVTKDVRWRKRIDILYGHMFPGWFTHSTGLDYTEQPCPVCPGGDCMKLDKESQLVFSKGCDALNDVLDMFDCDLDPAIDDRFGDADREKRWQIYYGAGAYLMWHGLPAIFNSHLIGDKRRDSLELECPCTPCKVMVAAQAKALPVEEAA